MAEKRELERITIKKDEPGFVACANSLKVHKTNCPYSKNIIEKIEFLSIQDAIDAGCTQCRCVIDRTTSNFIASMERIHKPNCPFAHNINKENLFQFESKEAINMLTISYCICMTHDTFSEVIIREIAEGDLHKDYIDPVSESYKRPEGW